MGVKIMGSLHCHICGRDNEASEDRLFCVMCGADLSGSVIESTLMESKAAGSYATSDKIGDIRKEAFIYLTDKRLIVIPADVNFSGINLTGALTAVAAKTLWNKITSGQSSLISVPLENVKSVKDGKFGLLVKALIIETKDGELVKMTAPKLNEWKEAIAKAAKI